VLHLDDGDAIPESDGMPRPPVMLNIEVMR
jgi:hypothetical protein